MRNYRLAGVIVLDLLLTSLTGWGQQNIKGSGYILTQQRNTKSFNTIEVSQGIDVAVVQGNLQPLTIEADNNLFPYIKTQVKNQTLYISIPDSIRILKYAAMNVLISLPELRGIKAHEHSRIDAFSQTWPVQNIYLEATTGARIRIRLQATHVQVEARTSSYVELKGQCQQLNASLKTAAQLEARELKTAKAFLALSIGAKAQIEVEQLLTYDLSGHSRLLIKGSPKIEDSSIISESKIVQVKQ